MSRLQGRVAKVPSAWPRALAAALTMVAAAALAVAAALGVVALLEATPDQPNTPLITYENAGQER